jgi:hypothetical protein
MEPMVGISANGDKPFEIHENNDLIMSAQAILCSRTYCFNFRGSPISFSADFQLTTSHN